MMQQGSTLSTFAWWQAHEPSVAMHAIKLLPSLRWNWVKSTACTSLLLVLLDVSHKYLDNLIQLACIAPSGDNFAYHVAWFSGHAGPFLLFFWWQPPLRLTTYTLAHTTTSVASSERLIFNRIICTGKGLHSCSAWLAVIHTSLHSPSQCRITLLL